MLSWGEPGPGRHESNKGCDSCQATEWGWPSAQGSVLMDPTLTSADMRRGDNCTEHLLVLGIPSMSKAWGLWTLLGLVTLLLLISLAVHLSQQTRGWSKSRQAQGHSERSMEEVPLYGNLHYLQTGRLSQEPRPDQQDPSSGGPARAAEEVMCYTSLQLRPPQGRITSSDTPIKYSEVMLDSEPKPSAMDPEPELYASVCAQARRARASFPDQAYANSQPAPS